MNLFHTSPLPFSVKDGNGHDVVIRTIMPKAGCLAC